MKLVLTVVARDEADVLDAFLAFHLSAGVDFVIATDHLSRDGTTEILERYEQEGLLHLIREEDPVFRQSAWVTQMARLATTEYGADWVINSDADEFWWPRGADLKEVLASIPARYGLVRAFWRVFPPRPDDCTFFAERMVVRLSATAAVNEPASPWRPTSKVIHRADPTLTVSPGSHAVASGPLQPLRGWFPVEVLHFPWRSYGQCERKASVYESNRFHEGLRRAHDALAAGRIAEHYDALAVDGGTLERGLADGTLVSDTRLRDALRDVAGRSPVPPASESRFTFALPEAGTPGLRFPRPTIVDDADYAVEIAALGEADVVRMQRRLDELEGRLSSLERRPSARVGRRLRRLLRRPGAAPR